jgi:5-(carboxyamino)imidazole ribonucleotide synthase
MSKPTSFMIAPGGWLGLLGGGQLGRMFCHAAQSLGYKVAVLDPADECPAGMVADLHIQAAYDDEAGLARLAQTCQAVTTEFENVPADSLRTLVPRQPGRRRRGHRAGPYRRKNLYCRARHSRCAARRHPQ